MHQRMYRIYSINRPKRLLNFWTLRVGAYSRWALIRGWALIKFSPFLASEVCLFWNKTIKLMLITKCGELTKQGFCKILWRKLRPRGSLLVEFIHSSGWGGGECLFELDWEEEGPGAYSRLGTILTFSAFRMGAYSRWALIRSHALIRINTVCQDIDVIWLLA